MNKFFYSKGFLRTYDRNRLLNHLITMKLTGFLLASTFMVSYGSTNAQITLKAKNAKVEQVLKNISKQTGYQFIYEEGLLKNVKADINFQNVTLNKSLNEILKKNNFTYTIHGKNIVVSTSPLLKEVGFKENLQIVFKGRVLDHETNLPIPGATIIEGNTSNVAQTDNQGNFSINLSSSSSKVFVRMVGYESVEVTYSSTYQEIRLKSTQSDLDEVVVVGFGRQKKASVVGAISTVSAKELKVPTSTLSNAFAGRVAGIVAVQRGAEPGADGSNFWIRGISTFAGPSSPLIFIDGIESSSAEMNNLPPEAIDNFSVLKDASATALYGARGANGVLLITTKRGGDFEKARINFRIENTFSSPTKPVTFANAVDYMEGYNYALTNRGLAARFSDEKIQNTKNQLDPIAYPDVDWYDVMFKDYSTNQYGNFNVAGGGKKADYFVSANFTRDNGLLRKDPFYDFDNNIKIQKYNLIGNVGVNLTEKTKAVIRLNSRLDDYNGANLTSSEIYSRLFTAPPALFVPTLPADVANPDHIYFGNLDGGPHPSGAGGNIYYNPYAAMVTGYRTNFTTTNMAALEVNQNMDWLLDGLMLKGLVSYANKSESFQRRTSTPFYYEVSDFNNTNGNYEYTYRNVTRGTTALTSTLSSTGDRLMNLNFVLDWGKTFGQHGVSAMVAYLSRDYNPNNPGSLLASLPTRNQGVAGRLTYQFKDRYFFEGNFGYNGSESFAKGNRFGFFPSLAAGYMISNEDFWLPLKSTISSLKFRGSWGLVGNAAVYDGGGNLVRFPYREDVTLNGRGFTFGDNWQTSQSGAIISKLGFPEATWETGSKYNFGVDITLFRDKLSLTADLFKEDRDGIFMQRRMIPAEAGVVGLTPYANIGRVKSHGFDASMSYQINVTDNFYLNFRGTFTLAKNEIIARDEPKQLYAYQSEIGLPLGLQYGFIADGYYKDEADVANSAQSSFNRDLKPGDIKYRDLNEDGVINDFDKTYYGNPSTPQIIYGFGLSSSYKKFDLSFFFQGAAKTSLSISGIHPFNNEASTMMQYLVGNYWTENNTNAMYPRLVTGAATHHNFHNSTHWMRDGSFVRLKNAEMGYTYKFARVFLSGQNLLTFSDFKLWDVELGGGNGLRYPNNRVISLGAQLSF